MICNDKHMSHEGLSVLCVEIEEHCVVRYLSFSEIQTELAKFANLPNLPKCTVNLANSVKN